MAADQDVHLVFESNVGTSLVSPISDRDSFVVMESNVGVTLPPSIEINEPAVGWGAPLVPAKHAEVRLDEAATYIVMELEVTE